MRGERARRDLCGEVNGQGGFTLLELLVAVALLALLGVMSLRALDSVLRTRDTLSLRHQSLQRLSSFFAQVDADFRQMPPQKTGIPMFGGVAGERDAQLNLVRDAALASEPSRLVRVAYRLRGNEVQRLLVPLAQERPDEAAWRAVLPGVRRLAWSTWQQGRWVELAPSAPVAETPEGVLVRVEREDGQQFERIYAIKR